MWFEPSHTFLVDGITEETILSAVIENYYFPILAGRLVVEVGRDMIDADTFIDIAHRTDNGASRVPLAFLKQVSDAIRLNNEPRMIALTRTERLASTDFPVEQIEQMKSAFATGELVRLCVAINLKPRSCPEAIGHYDLFLRACIDEEELVFAFCKRSNNPSWRTKVCHRDCGAGRYDRRQRRCGGVSGRC